MRFGLGLGLGMTSAAPLSLSPASTSVNMGSTQTFTAAGGTPGYTYSLHTNNTGGSIDASTGVYTPGWTPGVDTVRVTDSLGATADSAVTAVFEPTALTNILYDYDPNDSGNITIVSGHVSQLKDRTGSDANKHLAQATSGNRPVYNATDAAYNNKPTLQATAASSQWMESGVWSSAQAQPITLYIVGNLDHTSGGFLASGPVGGHNSISNANTPTVWEMVAGGSYIDSAVSPDSPAVIACVFNGASSNLYVDNHTTAAASGNPGTNSTTQTSLFALVTGIAFGQGKMARWIAFSGAHDATTRGHLFTALGATYGISVT